MNSKSIRDRLLRQKEPDEIVRKCYLKILDREPDEIGFKHYTSLIQNNSLNESELIKILENSPERKGPHFYVKQNGLGIREWMQKDWNKRAEVDPMLNIGVYNEDRDAFWKQGINDFHKLTDSILHDKNTKKMKAVDIGCGMGKLLRPMADTFEQAIGIDHSEKMVSLCKEQLKDLQNVKVFVNNGSQLPMLSDNSYDFCLCNGVLPHILDKTMQVEYFSETSRILKSGGLFKFGVHGKKVKKWHPIKEFRNVYFTSKEMHKIAEQYDFEILEEGNENKRDYKFLFRKK